MRGASRTSAGSPRLRLPTLARVPGDDPLLEVCRLVGEACGAEVHAPPFGATGDPLRLIARLGPAHAARPAH